MRTLRLVVSLWVLLPAAAWAAGPTLTFGVFASRPEAILVERYEPLAEYLSEAIGNPVELQLLNQSEMDRALASNRLDFIATNPSHFLVIRSERSLTGVLATMVRTWQGTSTTSLGGVIITSAGRTDINGLQDLRGKSIAAPGEHFLGGYQAQVLELMEAGLDVRRSNRIKLVGSHDRVIRAVLTGDADVGFVRSGLLEQLNLSQPGLMDQFRVVNEQGLTGFPFRVSTRLYPEWPLVALPHVDSRVIRRAASALFALEADTPVARASGIAGFSPPADYQSVEYLARKLRIAPYNKVPEVTWIDALHQYRIWVFTVLVLVMLLVTSTLWLAKRTRQLSVAQGRLRRLIMSWPQPMMIIQGGVFVDTNRSAVDLFGYASGKSLMGKDIAAFSPELQPDGQLSRQKMTALIDRVSGGEVNHGEWVFRRADGASVWVDMTIAPAYDSSESIPFLLCSLYDITGRKQAEQKQRLAASVFDYAREAIFITDRHGTVVDVNDAYVSITRSPRSCIIGRQPPLPVDEGSSVFQSARSQGFWHGEFTATRGDGEPMALAVTISSVRDDNGDITHFVGIFSDVTRLKEQEQKLLTLAHYDALTGLPNRVLFADRLQQAMAQARRQEYKIAVVYIDLDEFKPVNDAFGHEAGDTLLVQVANRMRLALREEDTLARLGGDEFSAVVVNVPDEDDLEGLLSRLLRSVSAPVWVSNYAVEVSASIGYTLFPQLTDLDGDQLLRQADQAMYRAKQQGKNRYCRFFLDSA
ncbi:diguanylate cyclase domain-containing protein [Marinobacter sp. F4206]|uniref:diguanylate cyclase domain-containing protein n=1 Tax=Marinobacter sp. F4206 TaxID=2861777 RepID=UPI001C5D3C59|nr:diguanylate cyclase [Marinobacter sp. F4206]MBW4934755.1 PhnD/SsuA/transferrin family substrate-binding protein [Marinobacter sp. F4206]